VVSWIIILTFVPSPEISFILELGFEAAFRGRNEAVVYAAPVEVQPRTPERARQEAEVREMVKGLLPMFTLANGRPTTPPEVALQQDCGVDISAGTIDGYIVRAT